MGTLEQCAVCYHTIEFEDGVAYCFFCDEIYVDPQYEDDDIAKDEIDDYPF